jgi:translation initiation factor 2 gamma subunit (eIF-2gamma)
VSLCKTCKHYPCAYIISVDSVLTLTLQAALRRQLRTSNRLGYAEVNITECPDYEPREEVKEIVGGEDNPG